MASPAAVLSILVEANTSTANAALVKTQGNLERTAVAGRAASTQTSKTGRASAAASKGVRALGTAAKYGGLALAAGLVIEGKKSIEVTQDLAKTTWGLHKNLGFTTTSASGLASVLKARGVDSNKAQIAFKALATQIRSAGEGSAESVKTFKDLGISQKELEKHSHNLGALMPAIADGLQKVGAGADRTALAQKLFGRGALTLLPILRDGSKAYNDQIGLVNKYGAVLKGEALKNQVDFLAVQRESKIAWQGMQVQLSNDLIPVLTDVHKQFQRIAAISASKKLTPDEKFQKISRIIQRDFRKAMDFVLKLIPEIANHVGKTAPKVAEAFVQGFMKSDAWGKLAIGAFLVSKFTSGGITGTLGKLGAWAGKKWVVPFLKAIGERIAAFKALTILSGAEAEAQGTTTGTRWGKGFGKGAIVGIVLGIALIVEEIRRRFGKKIDHAFNEATRAVDNFGGKFKVALAPVRFALHSIMNLVHDVWKTIEHLGELVSDLVHGRWGKAWGDLKKIAGDALRWVMHLAQIFLGPLYDAAKWIRSKWGKLDLKAPFRGIAHFASKAFAPVKDAISWIVGKVKWLLDKIPDIHVPGLPSSGGSGILGTGVGPNVNPLSLLPHAGGRVTSYGKVAAFAGGGPVGARSDTVPALLTPGEFVIRRRAAQKIGAEALSAMNRGGKVPEQAQGLDLEGKAGKKLVEATRKAAKNTAEALTTELGKGHKVAGKDTSTFVLGQGRLTDKMRRQTATDTGRLAKNTIDDFQKTATGAGRASERMKDKTAQDFERTRSQASQKSKAMAKSVGSSFSSMAHAVRGGLAIVATSTNKALNALGVKTLNFGVGKAPTKKARGGHIGGSGDGDKVPAMLEPGEFVVNKRAARKHRGALEQINFRDAPRFAKGGAVKPNLGGHPSDIAPALAKLIGIVQGQFPGLGVSATTDGSHVANSDHYTGHAVDLASSSFGYMDKAAGWIVHSGLYKQLKQGIHNPNLSVNAGQIVPASFYSAVWAGHRDHIHLAVYDALKGAFGAAAQKVANAIVKGPNGPMKELAQAAIDKVHSAAQALVDKKAAAADVGTGISADGNVERVFARVAKKLSTSKTATLALGEAGFAESGMRDLAGGDSSSQGALQLLASTASSMGINPHDEGAISSAFLLRGYYGKGGANKLAAQGLPAHLVAQGVQGSAFADGSNYADQVGPAKGWMQRYGLRRGGWIGLQGGGSAGKDGKSIGDLTNRALSHLSRDRGNKRQDDALKELLSRIHDEQKGTPIKDTGQLHDWLEKLALLELKLKHNPKSEAHQRDLNGWLKRHAKDVIHALKRRHDKYAKLKYEQQKASHTPGSKDDERAKAALEQFLGEGERSGLLDKIKKARKGVPIKDWGRLHDDLTRLDVLSLSRGLPGREGKDAKATLKHFLAREGRYILGALRYRGDEWKELKRRQAIAKKTPDPTDDKRIAALVAKFLGKKKTPGGAADSDAIAQTQAFFDFLKLLGPTTPLSTFAAGGAGKGTWARVGEHGPELAHLPVGSHVHSTAQSSGMLAPNVVVVIEDGAVDSSRIKVIVDGRIQRHELRSTRAETAGVSPSR